MSIERQRTQGFTLAEVLVAVTLSVLVVGGIMAAYVQGLLITQQEEINTELQFNLEKATLHLRTDLRLSSVGISMMSFFPTNSDKFTAISLPLSVETNGYVKVGTNGYVVWNQTVIYHVAPGSPDRLMRTVFQPRYTNAADLLYSQLAMVATATSMSQYANARLPFGSPVESVSTNVIFANLVRMGFTSGDTNSTFDCYSAKPKTGNNVFGSLVIGPGDHTVEFRALGKNSGSTNYNFGVDKLTLSPSRSRREGEIFAPVDSHPVAPYYRYAAGGAGGSAVANFLNADADHGIISGLRYTNGLLNSVLTMTIYNDLWCDTLFDMPDALATNCSAKLDFAFLSLPPYIPDYVVSPDKGTAWTGSSCGDPDVQMLTNTVIITNFIYGVNATNNFKIDRDGRWARFWFEKADGCCLIVTNASVIDFNTGVSSNITFNGGLPGVYMPHKGSPVTNSDWVQMWDIGRTGRYGVVFSTLQRSGDWDLDMFVGESWGFLRFWRNDGSVSNASFPACTSIRWQYPPVYSGGWPSSAAFGDIDGDGDLDLFLGSRGTTMPSFKFYRNQGDRVSPVMVDESATFPTVCNSGTANATPVLVDLNRDGLLDFVSGYQSSPGLVYLRNTGTATNPVFTADTLTINGGMPVPPGPDGHRNSAPAFVDIDGDGLLDLFCGQGDGYLSYWRNVGPGNPVFIFVTAAYSNLCHVPLSPNSMPAFADIDGDGLYDLFVGADDGKVYYYHNIGTPTNAVWADPDTNYAGVAVGGGKSAPVFANIDGPPPFNAADCWVNGPAFSNGYPLASVNGMPTNRTIGLNSIEVGYATYSTYRSGVFDTLKMDPAYHELNFTRLQKEPNGVVDVRVRSSASPDMTVGNWTDAKASDNGYFSGNVGNSLVNLPRWRYVQYEARFTINGAGTTPWVHTNDRPDAVLRDVTIDWPGAQVLVDLNADLEMGPDCGIISATVDGQSLVKGVGVTAEIYKAGRTGTNTVRGALLVRPLNSRK